MTLVILLSLTAILLNRDLMVTKSTLAKTLENKVFV